MKDLINWTDLFSRENIIAAGNACGLPIFCYSNFTEEKCDGRAFPSMEAFFKAFPSAEVTAMTEADGEVRVYC